MLIFLFSKRLFQSIMTVLKNKVFISLLTLLIVLNLLGVLFYTNLENWSFLDALYFSWVSLVPSSIDIGLSPQTPFGKLFTMFYLVIGVGIMIAALAIIAKAVVEVSIEENKIRDEQKKQKAFEKELDAKKKD